MYRFIGKYFTRENSQEYCHFPGSNYDNSFVKEAEQKISRNRGSYSKIGPVMKAKIDRFTAEYGNMNAARKFSRELSFSFAESSVKKTVPERTEKKSMTRKRLEFCFGIADVHCC